MLKGIHWVLENNQAVLLPAFLAAYSGSNASDVSLGIFRSFPIPNWSVKYNGLMRYNFFKRILNESLYSIIIERLIQLIILDLISNTIKHQAGQMQVVISITKPSCLILI